MVGLFIMMLMMLMMAWGCSGPGDVGSDCKPGAPVECCPCPIPGRCREDVPLHIPDYCYEKGWAETEDED